MHTCLVLIFQIIYKKRKSYGRCFRNPVNLYLFFLSLSLKETILSPSCMYFMFASYYRGFEFFFDQRGFEFDD